MFELGDIGGPEGVGHWITLCLRHRRAAAPIVNHRLFDGQTQESRLLATCAAMEYWVSSQARAHPWAEGIKGFAVPVALADRVSDAFEDWVGDRDQWADRVWDCNNRLKHDPAAEFSVEDMGYLELSARWLLTAVLLDSCASSTDPSQRIFGRSLWSLGEGMRSHFGWNFPGSR
ncbi:hypothetical protein EKO23_01060 [Nocardioides guangzhouensis]|uniref:ApeA N-terminal domain-containing protein n=1 Tax=Nocardioides guangzhouensis TaxID=2497878 RepID=A0A4Q4ZKU6_9ACTN|nr:HEPN domain-containing protein [Nocardioides guangzhouensis]RYP89047.1 hypothetical protein EKO23_01060 [Nocardioides guangzhouensis]